VFGGGCMLRKKIRSNLILVLLFTCFFVAEPKIKESTAEPLLTLFGITGGSTRYYDVLIMISQHLARIGIQLNTQFLDWGIFLQELFVYGNFDVFYIGLTRGEVDPDVSDIYCENGSLNIFGYDITYDWDDELGTGKNEWYLQYGKTIMPPHSEERIQHYWEWQQYFMDKVLLLKPTFLPTRYFASWSNLHGYDANEGLKNSWGKLSWDGFHEGQDSTSEIVFPQAERPELNPFYISLIDRDTIPTFIFDSLLTYDHNIDYYPHLAQDWSFINNTHCRVHLRQGIKWQDDPKGLFTDEYFDADDVIFSYFVWKNISVIGHLFNWLKDIKKVDQYTVDFFIDGDISTPENDNFAPIYGSLAHEILPEHFLNQSQEADGITPDVTHESWITFSQQPFGTSLFELDYFNEIEIVLKLYEDSWWLDPSVDKADMNFEERFGNFSSGINKLTLWKIENRDQAIALFLLGKADFVDIGAQYTFVDECQLNPNFEVYDYLPFSFRFMGYNIRESRQPIGSQEPAPGNPSITKGLALRKAIAYAINRDEITQILYGGERIIQDHPLYQHLGKWLNPNIIRYNFNLDKAREYMAIAGYGELPIHNGLKPREIAGIVISSVIAAGSLSLVIYWLYRKGK
jgi:ABC-type transport system substrate-binding protein